jgi:hypothetical protein
MAHAWQRKQACISPVPARGSGTAIVSYLPARRQTVPYRIKDPDPGGWKPSRGVQRTSTRGRGKRALWVKNPGSVEAACNTEPGSIPRSQEGERAGISWSVPHAKVPKGFFSFCVQILPMLFVNIGRTPCSDAASGEAWLTSYAGDDGRVDTPDL